MSYIVARALERRQEELKELERDTAPLERVQPPFPRISYTDAVARLNALGSDIKWGDDLGGDDETLLAEEYDRPVFVFNYPKEVKAFYMKENPDDPRTVLNNDCLAPEGYGEIIGGSQREDDYDKLLARIQEQGLDPEAYRWYLDLRKYGTFVHSGFGLGLERTVAWICGHPAHPGGDRVPAADPPAVSRRRRSGHPDASVHRLHLVPQPSSTSSPAPSNSIPRASASRSTASNRSRNFRLARSSAGPGCTPAFRARLTTANSRSPISSTSASLGRGAGRVGIRRLGRAPAGGRRASSASTSASSSRTFASGPATSGQSNPTDAARSCSR